MFIIDHELQETSKQITNERTGETVEASMTPRLKKLSAFGTDWPYISFYNKWDSIFFSERMHITDMFKFASKIVSAVFGYMRQLPSPIVLGYFQNENRSSTRVHIRANQSGVTIAIDGYGTYIGGKNDSIIHLDLEDKYPQLYVWENPLWEGPSHIISLRSASNEFVPDDEEYDDARA
jgi:hypothetical protein